MRRVGIVLGLFVLLLGLGCLGAAAAARREFDLQQYLKLPEVREHQQRNPAVAITSAALSPRRNHGCVVRPATAPQYLPLPEPQRPLEALLFAGRWGANVEVIDFASGRHSMKTDDDVPVLNANHVAAEYVPSVDGSRQEIWIVCSFSGDKVDKEVTNKNVVIIDTNTWQARRGPALDMPRGACSSFQIDGPATGSWHYSPLAFHHHHSSSLKQTNITSHNLSSSPSSSSSRSHSSSSSSGLPEGWIKGRLVCVVGGFVGAHDKGYSVDLVSCYDRVAEKWHTLPPLAHSMDHHTVLFVAGGTCADETRDRVLSISGRSGPYNTTLNRIQQLVLGEPEWTTWQLPSPFVANAASASVTQSGIIFFVGGIEYQPGRPSIRHKDITLMDVCSLKFCHSRSTLMNPKWAIVACPSPHDDWLVICGGDSTMTNSNKNSPYCETLQLPLLQEDCDQQKAWKPLASFKPK